MKDGMMKMKFGKLKITVSPNFVQIKTPGRVDFYDKNGILRARLGEL